MLPKEVDNQNLIDQAEALMKSGKYTDAEAICRFILQKDAKNLEAHFLLGNSAYQQKKWIEAAQYYKFSIATAPDIGFLHANLALALLEAERYQEAQVALDNSIQMDGATAVSHFHQGLIYQKTERCEDAINEYKMALTLDPKHLASRINLTAVLLETAGADQAIEQCRLGLELAPENIPLTGNLAVAYGKKCRYDESLDMYQRLLKLLPEKDKAEVMGQMANLNIDAWRVDEAIKGFELAAATSTDLVQKRALGSTRLFVLHYSGQWSSEAISREHFNWGATYFKEALQVRFGNIPDPEKRLRVAYISPDFKIHAVIFFLQPVLAAHNREQVEIYCYSDVKKPDEVTRQLKDKHGVIWRDVAALDNDTVQQMLLDDKIDISVDLAGHTGGNRLPLFARRIAPVQSSWIGYPNTTGLTAMDYRLTDPKADPPGMTEKFHTEELVHLSDSFLCYRPGADFLHESPLPMLLNRFVTFGSLSNFAKVTPDILELWARILAALPGSRLILRARGITDEGFRKDMQPLFDRHGVTNERIGILGDVSSLNANLRAYHLMDISLDTFPYNGTTTTCESLYMGVPVVTLAGDSHLSRVGASLLQSVGIAELITETAEEYVAAAVALAGDLKRLLHLRKSLRGMMLASPLADNITFTNNLEAAYRMMWRRWCENQRRTNRA